MRLIHVSPSSIFDKVIVSFLVREAFGRVQAGALPYPAMPVAWKSGGPTPA